MQSAAHGESPARETLEVIVRLLGSVAGNLALTLNARGGVYLAGGVLQSVGTEHWESVFRAAFIGKHSWSRYLEDIPTRLVTDPFTALQGSVLIGDQ